MLAEWPHEPGKINVRLIAGLDGTPRIQVRLDLGILQMEVDGRPDGAHPEGFESLLEYHETRLEEAAFEADFAGEDEDEPPADTDAPPIELDNDECRALRDEALQYYHRYVALLVLEDFTGVVRDTSRNLRVLDLLAEYAADERDQESMEAHRPYVMMMRTRALASQALADGEHKAALVALDNGLEALKGWYAHQDRAEAFETSDEAEALRQMRQALVPKLPVSQKAELRQRLQEALLAENYELAAILRDELRMLGE